MLLVVHDHLSPPPLCTPPRPRSHAAERSDLVAEEPLDAAHHHLPDHRGHFWRAPVQGRTRISGFISGIRVCSPGAHRPRHLRDAPSGLHRQRFRLHLQALHHDARPARPAATCLRGREEADASAYRADAPDSPPSKHIV